MTLKVKLRILGIVLFVAPWFIIPSLFARWPNPRELDRDEYPISIPLGLVYPTFPSGTAPTREEVALGRKLFHDPSLSLDRTISCATCHDPRHVFADHESKSKGIGGVRGRRNSPTIINSAFFEAQSWDGRHASLEDQALAAIANSAEMGLDLSKVSERIEETYGARLRKAYGEVSATTVAKALAAFQRTLIAGDSPLDRYVYRREDGAITKSAKRGFKIFLTKGRCIQCHAMRCEECHPFGGSTAFFTDNRFHNLGVGFNPETRSFEDAGRAEKTGNEAERGAFKTPTLRNVELTAPYMHDGSLATLGEVVEHYNKGGIPNPNLDPEIRPLHLTEQEKADLVEFLKALTTAEDFLKTLTAEPEPRGIAESRA